MNIINDKLELNLDAVPEGWSAMTSEGDRFVLLYGPQGHEIMATFGFLPGNDGQIVIVYHTPDGEQGLFYAYKIIGAERMSEWPTAKMAKWTSDALNHLMEQTPVRPRLEF